MTDRANDGGTPDDEIAELVDSIDALDGSPDDPVAESGPPTPSGTPEGDGSDASDNGTDGPAGAEPDGTGGAKSGDPDTEDVEELLEKLDAETEDGSAEEADPSDPRAESFGNYAGVAVTIALAFMLFVGPWRLFDLALGSGPVPFELRETTGMNILYVAPIPIALIGFVTGGIYRATTQDPGEEYRSDIVVPVIGVQAVVAVALFGLFMLIPVGSALLDGAFGTAILAVVLGVVYLLFFTFFEFVGMVLYIGIPAFVGVAIGGLVGGLLE